MVIQLTELQDHGCYQYIIKKSRIWYLKEKCVSLCADLSFAGNLLATSKRTSPETVLQNTFSFGSLRRDTDCNSFFKTPVDKRENGWKLSMSHFI